MAKYEIEYEVIGHHYKTIEVPDDDASIKAIEDLNESYISDDHPCEEYHGDPIEECIITSVSKVEEKE